MALILQISHYNFLRKLRGFQVWNTFFFPQVSIPQIVSSEFSSINLSEERLTEDHTNPLHHPLTGSSRRYADGDRFHTTTNPHKSHLCQFHDINLCLQQDTIKTSYQECQNNSKNIKRLRCSTMPSFPVHFIYNYLMDFYHNEEIVEKQRKQLASTLKEGQSLKRDRFLRFVVVSEQSYSLYIFYFDAERLRKNLRLGVEGKLGWLWFCRVWLL